MNINAQNGISFYVICLKVSVFLGLAGLVFYNDWINFTVYAYSCMLVCSYIGTMVMLYIVGWVK